MADKKLNPLLILGGAAGAAYILSQGGQGQSARGRRDHLIVGEKAKWSQSRIDGLVDRYDMRSRLYKRITKKDVKKYRQKLLRERLVIGDVFPGGYAVQLTPRSTGYFAVRDAEVVAADSTRRKWPGDHYEGKTPPGHSARGRRAHGGETPRTWKQLNKWLLKNGYGYKIVVTRMSEMPAYYGGWHRYVDAVEGHPQPFGDPDSDFWYSSSVYALSPSVKTYDEWVEAIKDLSQGEGGNISWS